MLKQDRSLKNLNNYFPYTPKSNLKTSYVFKSNNENCNIYYKQQNKNRDKLHYSLSKSYLPINQNNIMIQAFDQYLRKHQQPKKHRLLLKNKQRNKNKLIFKLGPVLGTGQFGNVYLVQHQQTRSLFAMKKISLKGASEKLLKRIVQQIKVQMFLDHTNCLKIYKAYREDNNIVLILQLGNQTLFDLLRYKKYFSERQTALYLRQVINALKYMHSHHIIHRDIKPENLILFNDVVKIGDFGWAIHSHKKRTTFCGTLDYISPQIVTGVQYDQMIDVWSVGVLCYELCTGHAPFDSSQGILQTYQRILNVDLKFPKYLSLEIRNFISNILTQSPEIRMTLEQALEHPWLKQYQKQFNGLFKNKIGI